MRAKPIWLLESHWCPLREGVRGIFKGSSLTCFWHKAITTELKLFSFDYQRELRNIYSAMSSLSKSYTILFPLPTFQLHHKFRTTIKSRRVDPRGKRQSTSLSYKVRKASDIWKKNPSGGGKLYIIHVYLQQNKINFQTCVWKLQSRTMLKNLLRVKYS